MRRVASSTRLLVATAFRADALRTLAVFALSLAARAGVVAHPLLLKLMLEAVAARDQRQLLMIALAFGVTSALGFIAAWTSFTLSVTLQDKTGLLIDQHLIELTAGLPGLEHHERPEYLDEMEMLRSQREELAGGVRAIVETVSTLAGGIGMLVLLGSVHPLLLALPLFAVPSLVAAGRADSLRQQAMESSTEDVRRARHFYDLATTSAPSMEVRIFGLGDTLVERHRRIWAGIDLLRTRARIRGTIVSAGGWTIFALGYVGALAFVLHLAAQGEVTAPEVLLALSVAAQVNQNVAGIVGLVASYLRSLKVVDRYRWLIDYSVTASLPLDRPQTLPPRLRSGISLRGVGFAYPGVEQVVLHDVDLDLPAGSTVALVGDNGAGKTTLIKLLCRFYEPTEGSITVDGVDLSEVPVDQWRRRLAAGFQDYARLELRARENVGVGDLPLLDDVPAVTAALQRASADDVAATLPEGLETQLGKAFDDGVELSGGQWQKLALGRAMMRTNPLLLVLDEPTASLDPQTEHALFERYAGAARRAAGETGAITVLVSHRFSTVRMADLIVVVDGGTVTEVGSHTQLLAREGLYAELFELQARAYR